jgi:hypothetical protein
MHSTGLIEHTQFFKNQAELTALAPIIEELASAFNRLTDTNFAIHSKLYSDLITQAATEHGGDAA